jgi:hypothetical protein
MGRVAQKTFAEQKSFAINLAKVFIEAGARSDVQFAQCLFATNELKAALKVKRKPLGKVETLDNLLKNTWETPLPSVMFNLWQNSPGAAYKLVMASYNAVGNKDPQKYFDNVWTRLNNSTFANWSYAKPENKSPRIFRIQKAIKEFYGLDLKVYKP